MSAAPAKPRLLVLNQYYWPGVEATANLLTELCEALADEFDVRVVTGLLYGHEDEPRHLVRNGVAIERVRSTSYERSQLVRRGANYVTYLGSSLAAALRGPRPDVVLCMTDPPMVGDVALAAARRFHAPLLVISMDVFPEIAVELKRLENPLAVGLLRGLVGLYLERADRVVAIGETMRRRLEEKGTPSDRLAVIPNWVDTTAITPQGLDNPWARANALDGRFVVMHSGNVGHAQNLDNLVRSATFLRDLDDLRILIVGFGARSDDMLALVSRLEVDNVRFKPYQPREVLAQSLSSADVHFVGLGKGLSGYVVPSRLYGILAAGRPVIVAADEDSETARIVREVECGVVIAPGRPEVLAATIRELRERPDELERMGARGREYVVAEADRNVAIRRYRELLRELTGTPAPDAAAVAAPAGS
ncbi:MAG TPA: glycosyltransferase family 4 protein [Gaiellaceae bacterium]|nr:glycosyltransferase family 4 protein [Gaiellaceae bacterium]